jgi:SnoaL-like domain
MNSAAIAEIVNVVNLYPVAVDSLRWDLFDQTFTEDAHVEFGGPAKWDDLASLKRDFAMVHRPFDATQHVTSNHQVVVNGDRANCLSYVHARFIRQVAQGGNMFESAGWYDDQLVKLAAGWRIRFRSCRAVWSGGNPLVLQTMPGVTTEQKFDSLSREAAAGSIDYFKAIGRG